MYQYFPELAIMSDCHLSETEEITTTNSTAESTDDAENEQDSGCTIGASNSILSSSPNSQPRPSQDIVFEMKKKVDAVTCHCNVSKPILKVCCPF